MAKTHLTEPTRSANPLVAFVTLPWARAEPSPSRIETIDRTMAALDRLALLLLQALSVISAIRFLRDPSLGALSFAGLAIASYVGLTLTVRHHLGQRRTNPS